MRQKILSFLTAGALTAALALPLAAGAAPADLAPGAWYTKAVSYCLENDIITPDRYGDFNPDEPMTRGMIAAALYQLSDRPEVDLTPEEFESGEESKDKPEEGEEPESAESPFLDVDLDDPDADAILWAWQEGLFTGYDDGTFGPDIPVSREQLSVILWNSLGHPLAYLRAPFTDRPEISKWAINAVEWAWYAGLIGGQPDGTFDPAGTTTRAQAAVIFMNYDQTFIHIPEAVDPGPIAPNRYDGSKYVKKGDFLTYTGEGPSYIGIDVSAHQKDIDWKQVAAAGVDFAMIRVGYRGYSVGSINKDAYFDYNIKNALANGIEVGVYFFSQAMNETEALEEARQTLDWIRGYDITYPVVFDWEQVDKDISRTKDADGATTTRCAQAFCQVVEDAGYIAMTYGSPSKIYAGGLDLAQLQEYPFWLAHYTTDWVPTSFRYHYNMWQYSSNGAVPGIPTRVDLNVCHTDFSKWKK